MLTAKILGGIVLCAVAYLALVALGFAKVGKAVDEASFARGRRSNGRTERGE